jgi:hypothetical protein
VKAQRAIRMRLSTAQRREEFMLGLAILATKLKRGQRATHEQIAAYTGITKGGVWMAEQKILHKLRKKLHLNGNRDLKIAGDAIGLKGAI